MKTKRILFVIILGFSMANLTAQMKVRNDGNIVALTDDQSEDESKDSSSKMVIRASTPTGLSIWKWQSGYYQGNPVYALRSYVEGKSGITGIGINGSINPSKPLGGGRAIGVQGTASNTTSGYNYGVVGVLYGSQDGTGIYGGVEYPDRIPGRYAGYFSGHVKVTGNLTATTVTTSSDLRYKKNITTLSKEKNETLENLLNLNPVKYNLQEAEINKIYSDTAMSVKKLAKFDAEELKKEHFGLIAQDVQKLYPNLVYADGDGYLSINYIGLIPVLIEAMKEQQVQMNELQTFVGKTSMLNVKSASETGDVSNIESVVMKVNSLYQNNPNPFSTSTEIRYALDDNIQQADMYIYDMQGSQIKKIANLAKGAGSITIEGYEFSAGMYIYTLIADGKEVDTKRMILTK